MKSAWKHWALSCGAALLAIPSITAIAQSATQGIEPGKLKAITTIDERFQSYNIEMVEVTGGRFWRPYASTVKEADTASQGNQPAGLPASLYEYRAPINLSNAKLRKLAAALGPAYLRVSGTWANTTFFQDSDEPAPATPPEGFKGVLTRAQWKGVVDFSSAANANLVTSFAVSQGTRGADGVWRPDQAATVLRFTHSVGGHIAAAEYMNEPTFALMGGAPKGYDAKAFARDVAVFHEFIKKESPETVFLGPGGVGEGSNALAPQGMQMLKSEDVLQLTGPVFDAFSYHSYNSVSERCSMGAKPADVHALALSADWLGRGLKNEAFYATLRDKYEPGKPLWNTENGEAACGGDRWAAAFLDTFRYLNQLGSLARAGVKVHIYNTLAASDYGLLDEKTYEPRPNYWAAVLWRRFMGTTVLDAGSPAAANTYLYAHCLRGHAGGVALLAINADPEHQASITLNAASDRLTLTAAHLEDKTVLLNGTPIALGANDSLPELKGTATKAGSVTLAPASISFFAIPKAGNANCKAN